jgi:hypothetical protein
MSYGQAAKDFRRARRQAEIESACPHGGVVCEPTMSMSALSKNRALSPTQS